MGTTMTTAAATGSDEAAIRGLIAAWSRALEAKDVEGLTAAYDPGVVLFDAIPPCRVVGVAHLRELWSMCLPCFPDDFTSEHRDVTVAVSGDVAFAHGLHRTKTADPDHPAGQTWLRFTSCYRRIEGQWRVVHEHISIPFNPMTNEAWYVKDPEQAFDWSAAEEGGCCGGACDS